MAIEGEEEGCVGQEGKDENYANGAGGNYKANYDVVNGKIITEVTNLMREDTPTETTIKHVEKREFAFENSNPRNVSF